MISPTEPYAWIERWEDQDFVVLARGKGIVHSGVFSKSDAEEYRDKLIEDFRKNTLTQDRKIT